MTTDQSDIVERLRGAAQGWRQEDALEYRVGEEEARLNDEAAAEITRLRAALAAEREAALGWQSTKASGSTNPENSQQSASQQL